MAKAKIAIVEPTSPTSDEISAALAEAEEYCRVRTAPRNTTSQWDETLTAVVAKMYAEGVRGPEVSRFLARWRGGKYRRSASTVTRYAQRVGLE